MRGRHRSPEATLGSHTEPYPKADAQSGSRDDAECELRSAQAVGYLRGRGFPQAVNLEGGINAWSATIDPEVPRY